MQKKYLIFQLEVTQKYGWKAILIFLKVFPGKEIENSGKLFSKWVRVLVSLSSQVLLWLLQVFTGSLQDRLLDASVGRWAEEICGQDPYADGCYPLLVMCKHSESEKTAWKKRDALRSICLAPLCSVGPGGAVRSPRVKRHRSAKLGWKLLTFSSHGCIVSKSKTMEIVKSLS